jgi:hypothetical protein
VAAVFGYPKVFSADMPLTTVVHSRHELSIVVTERDPAQALREAEREAHKHLSALGLAVGIQRYRFCPAVMNRLPGGGAIDPSDRITTGWLGAVVYESESLESAAVDYARTLVSNPDDTIGRAFGFLQAAWRLIDVPFGVPEVNKAVLSNCFLVVEVVSNAVTKEWRRRNKADTVSRQATTAEGLVEELSRNKGATERIRAVRRAYQEIQRADLNFQSLKIKEAGDILGVEKKFVDLAGELNDLRNQKLGHAGQVEEEELDEWIYKSEDSRMANDPGHFGKAEQTAMAYLRAYIDTCSSA